MEKSGFDLNEILPNFYGSFIQFGEVVMAQGKRMNII